MVVLYKQIPNMPAAIALAGVEELEVVQAGVSVRSTINQISSFVQSRLPPSGGGGGAPSGPAGGDLAGTYPNPTLNPEAIDDRVASLLVAGANVTLSYDDTANTLTIASTAAGGGGGTVTSTSVVTANGLAGTVATATTTPAITLRTTITGMLLGNGTAISAATAGTDYMTPSNVSAAYQPLDGDLTALAALSTTGVMARTAANTYLMRTITGTASRLTVTNGDGVAGNPTLDISATYDGLWQPKDATLTSLAAYNTNGLLTQTAVDTFTGRTITGTASRLAVTNGSGVSGNPTLDIDSAYVGQATITTLGTVTTGTWNGSLIAGQYGGTGVANTGKTITIGGNLVTSGAFASTFTMTGTTTVTFPTSGTLATLVDVATMVQNAQTGNYTAVLGDAGGHLYHAVAAAAATYTIPANGSVAYPIGTTLTFVNDSANAVTIAITTDTLVLSPGSTTGSRTLATGGVATAIKVTSTRWIINGTGLT